MSVDATEIILGKLERIEEDVTNTRVDVGKIQTHLKGINGKVNSHDARILSLEKGQYKLAAKVGAIVAVFAFVAEIIVRKFIIPGL